MVNELSWIKTARDLISQKEIPGPKSNPVIMEMAKRIGGYVARFYTNDDIPWCGLFVGHCLNVNNIKVPSDMLLAPAWLKYGTKLDKPKYGSIGVWKWANGHYHVSYLIGQNGNNIYALGGNQSDSVTITTYDKKFLVGYRWPEVNIIAEDLPNL